MKAFEFTTKIKKNKIDIPSKLQNEIAQSEDGAARVIILLEESPVRDEAVLGQIVVEKFLQGYDKADAIYDTYKIDE